MYKLRLNPIKNVTLKKVNYANFQNGINTTTDEYSTPITFSKNTYNFDYKNGALKTGLGIAKLEVDQFREGSSTLKPLYTPEGLDVLAVWSFDRYTDQLSTFDTHFIIYCSDNYLYTASLVSGTMYFVKLSQFHTFKTVPTAIKYKLDGFDCLIFTTPEDGMYVYSPSGYEKDTTNCPPITSMCVHYERLFATVNGEKISLWFSDDLDPTNWNISSTEGGFINMIDERGPLNKVLSFKDYVYIFREYGISRLTAYGDQQEFSVSHPFVSSTKIYEKTVCICGEVILMLLKDGIYAFDGFNTQKINLNIENIINANQNAVACYHNGKYYLACNISFMDDDKIGCENGAYTNNAIIELDYSHGTFTITRGIDVTYLYSSMDYNYSKLFAVYTDHGVKKLGFLENCGGILDTPMTKLWRSPKTDFGYPNKDKILKQIYFNAKQETTIIVETENRKKEFKVKPSNGKAKVDISMVAKEFAIHFKVDCVKAYISNPVVIVGIE